MPVGVMVTLIPPVWPGLTVTGVPVGACPVKLIAPPAYWGLLGHQRR